MMPDCTVAQEVQVVITSADMAHGVTEVSKKKDKMNEWFDYNMNEIISLEINAPHISVLHGCIVDGQSWR